jgi:hypothetical protein
MEKLSLNYHLKLQEMCDCYMETDFLPTMQKMAGSESADLEEDAIKYLALAIMFAITEKAEKLALKKIDGEMNARIKNGGKVTLPVPSAAVFGKIFEIMRAILHIEEDEGKMEFSLGLRSGEVNVMVKMAREDNKQSLKIKFPKQ